MIFPGRTIDLEVSDVKITEEILRDIDKEKSNFSDGIIMPDGDYRLLDNGHLHTLMKVMQEKFEDKLTEDDIWKMIPEGDSPLFWLVEKTGCVLTDYNSTVGMHMTPAQEEVFKAFVSHGIVTEQYFDLARQREKAREKPGKE